MSITAHPASRGLPKTKVAQEFPRWATRFGPWIAIIALYLIGLATISGFASPNSIGSQLALSAFLGVAAAGQTTVILLGGIDLSMASTIGLGEVVTSILYASHDSMATILLLLLGFGVAIGLINGGISAVARVHPLVVSLGTAFAVQGAVLIWTHGGMGAGASPPWLATLTSPQMNLGVVQLAPVVFVWLGWVVLEWAIERRGVIGRHIFALGSSEAAAVLGMARRRTTWIVAFIFSALSGEAAGVLLTGFSGGANFGVGSPYLFTTITAVVIGGTSLLGGAGGALRTVAGTLLVIEISTLLIGIGIGPNLQESLLGAFILVVAALSGREGHVRTQI
ncbi:MAG TPA: ABC transporter permease [Acidimicrobiales bacterium]|nr:ABC transporter permease [Acidimicrobiales bacterium]